MALTQNDIDWGGMTPHFNDIYYGATSQGQIGTKLDSSLITSLQQPGTISITTTGVNMNATGDTSIAIPALPTGYTRYLVNAIYISNASHTLASASVGVFTAASAGGQTVAAAQTPTVTATADATVNNSQALTLTNANTMSYLAATETTLFFHVATGEGTAATATVTVVITPLP